MMIGERLFRNGDSMDIFTLHDLVLQTILIDDAFITS